ncbi:MAG: AAA family ATPase [Cytophagales bacterium]|nr:AAA family ATPase [Cytophagales bacterium]
MKPDELILGKVFYQGANIQLNEASHRPSGKRLAVKTAPINDSKKHLLLRNEYELLSKLHEGQPDSQLALFQDHQKYSLVREYHEGHTLKEHLERSELSLEQCLELCISLCQNLRQVHFQHIIHKDICPDNIIIGAQGQATLVDFDLASQWQRHEKAQTLLQGRLEYISPEQTGRTNNSLDFRSDLYSLGSVFYFIFSKRPPFDFDDPLEQVHALLAIEPPSLKEQRPDLPAHLAGLVARLLAKNAEERYQSIHGLIYDLEQLARSGGHADQAFQLGQHDFSGQLHISRRIFEREAELQVLQVLHTQAEQSNSLGCALIYGASGVGKSALVQEFQKSLASKRVQLFQSGFNINSQEVPFSAWASIINKVAEYILALRPGEQQEWQATIKAEIGDTAQILVELSPRLGKVLGSMPTPPELKGSEAQNRFIFAVSAFVKAATMRMPGITFFFDDVQWADLGSVQLINTLRSNPTIRQCFLLLATNQKSEESNAVAQLLADTSRLAHLSLQNLTPAALEALLAESLGQKIAGLKELARVVYDRTQGNPFFCHQLIEKLYDDRLILFDHEHKTWIFDIHKITQTRFADNVIELLVSRLRDLDHNSQHVLKLCSLCGKAVRQELLANASGLPLVELEPVLNQLATQGYLVKNLLDEGIYRLGDERMRLALLAMQSPEEKTQNHLKLAQALLASTRSEEEAFELARHFAEADAHEPHALQSYDEAARLAVGQVAFGSALRYAQLGLAATPPDGCKRTTVPHWTATKLPCMPPTWPKTMMHSTYG